MTMNELFLQSSFFNALIFGWFAQIALGLRLLLNLKIKRSSAIFLSIFFGPLAFLFLRGFKEKRKKVEQKLFDIKTSSVAILLVSLLIASTFYFLFVSDENILNKENISYVVIFVIFSGFLGGQIIALLTKRLGFFECVWVVFILSFLTIFLKDWAENVFSYGTSLTYFITLELSINILLLVFLNLGSSLGYLFFGEGSFNPRLGF